MRWEYIPLGKIGQIVQGTILSSEFETTSSSFVDTGLSVLLTPTSTSSKFLYLLLVQL